MRSNTVIYGISSGHTDAQDVFYGDFLLSTELLFRGRFCSIRSRDGVQYDPYSVQYGPYSFIYSVIRRLGEIGLFSVI